MSDLAKQVVKTYPAQGEMQLFRLAAATEFTCSRCQSTKTAKLVAVVSGDWNRLLCNGSYGKLPPRSGGCRDSGPIMDPRGPGGLWPAPPARFHRLDAGSWMASGRRPGGRPLVSRLPVSMVLAARGSSSEDHRGRSEPLRVLAAGVSVNVGPGPLVPVHKEPGWRRHRGRSRAGHVDSWRQGGEESPSPSHEKHRRRFLASGRRGRPAAVGTGSC